MKIKKPEDAKIKESNNIVIPKYTLAIVPVVSLLLGIGATYGIANQTIDANTRRLDILEAKIDLIVELKTDVAWIKKEIENMNKSKED